MTTLNECVEKLRRGALLSMYEQAFVASEIERLCERERTAQADMREKCAAMFTAEIEKLNKRIKDEGYSSETPQIVYQALVFCEKAVEGIRSLPLAEAASSEEAFLKLQRDYGAMKDYALYLEGLVAKSGYRKVCSSCTFLCHPLWSNSNPPGLCEACDEPEAQERIP